MAKSGKRGFGSMDPERQKEIAALGGRMAHAKGTAHEWTSDEAKTAGRKGGESVSKDRSHMAAIGRLGSVGRVAKRRGFFAVDSPLPDESECMDNEERRALNRDSD